MLTEDHEALAGESFLKKWNEEAFMRKGQNSQFLFGE
jgi:hypothetical protein